MRLTPETRQRHARQPRYQQHTLAPDPQQPELELRPLSEFRSTARRFADTCRNCGSVHTTRAEDTACICA